MSTIPYAMIIKHHAKPELIRAAMVARYYALRKNASAVARKFGTKRQTVETWVRRYETRGAEGLCDMSRAPKTSPRKTPEALAARICELRISKKKRIGQDRIRGQLKREGLHMPSTSVINRILHAAELMAKRRKKWQTKRQCAEWKKKLRALRYWQIDVKYLTDIPELVLGIAQGSIPKYEYTARDVTTGTAFITYAYDISLINTIRFAQALLEHLGRWGIHASEVTIQTDNGSENIGSITAREDSGLTILIEQVYHGKHVTIPPATPRFNGSVESFHGRIEDEHYAVETVTRRTQFLSGAYTFILDWNLARVPLKGKTPFELIKQKAGILDPRFCDWMPWILDEMRTYAVPHYQSKSVPYVADEVTRWAVPAGYFSRS